MGLILDHGLATGGGLVSCVLLSRWERRGAMADFFDKVKDGINKGVSTVSVRSKELVEAGAGLNLYLMVRNRGALPAPGLARSGPRFCIQCGARNEGGNAFCTQCGARLEPGGYGGSARTSAPFSSPANVGGEAYGPGEDEVTTVLDDSGDTRLLEQVEEGEPFPVLRIKRAEEEEIIPINKPEFYIGRNREAVDYWEADNPSIGRVHAKIIRQDGAYYIVDLESKNGTYLNGERLSSNVPYPLSFKDKIRLANIEYTFDQP